MAYPLVSIIIPNYNGRKFIVNCLESVLKTDYPDFEIIVVDDGSTDNSAEIVERRFGNNSRIRLIRCSVNRGAAAGKNIGAKNALGKVFCFLDNDTEVKPDWLRHLVDVLFSDVHIGASQSLLLDYNKRDIIQVAGVKLVPYTGLAMPLLQGRKVHEVHPNPTEICALSAALAVKRQVFYEVGGFDERLVAYTEDLDFSWRVWLKGYRILLSPRSWVYHWTKTPEMRYHAGFSYFNFNFHLTKNSLRSILKNNSLPNLVRYFPVTLMVHLARVLITLKRRKVVATLGIIKGFYWNAANLRDTIKTRSLLQKDIKGNRVLEFTKVLSSKLLLKSQQ